MQTLAETLKAQGYRTGGFVGAFVLDARWGIAQGFDTYFDEFDLSEDVGPGLDAIQRRGGEVVDQALRVAGHAVAISPSSAGSTSTIPTSPYDAPAEYASRFPATRDGAYDAEIAYTDAQVGRLLTALDAAGRRDDTLVVVLADHGEQLGEHREQSHGFFVYDASVQMPLIMAGPGHRAAGGARSGAHRRRHADRARSAGRAQPPAAVQGASLRPALDGQRQELLAFSESWYPRFHYGWSELQAVRDGAYKFILAPTRELYDVVKDPGELSNLAATDQARADRMERALRALVAETSRAEAVKGPQAVDPAAEQRLRALGYVGSTSARHLEDRPRRDPKETIELYNLLQLAGYGFRGGPLRRRRRQGAEGAGRRSGHDRGPHAARQHLHQGRTPRRRRRRLPEGARARSRRTCCRPTTSPWPIARPARSTRPSSASSARSSSIRAAAARTSSSATSTCSAASRPRRSTC